MKKKRNKNNGPRRGVPDRDYEPSVLERMTSEQISAAAAGIQRALKGWHAGEPNSPDVKPSETFDANSGLVKEIQAIHPRASESEIREALGHL